MFLKLSLATWGFVMGTTLSPAQVLHFMLDPANSYTDGSVLFRLYTTGTLVGNFDALTNPAGTRTKPGLLGSFGSTENLPVAVAPFLQFGGAKRINTAGRFTLDMDKVAHTVRLSGYDVDRLANGPLALGATIALNNEAFRTQNPPLPIPANLPPVRLGQVTVTQLRVLQIASSNTGILLDLGPNRVRAIVNFMARVEMNVTQFGQQTPIRFTVPYSLVGDVESVGGLTTFGFGPGQGGENVTVNVNAPLNQFPLELNVTPLFSPGFKFGLTVRRASIGINGIRKLRATSGGV